MNGKLDGPTIPVVCSYCEEVVGHAGLAFDLDTGLVEPIPVGAGDNALARIRSQHRPHCRPYQERTTPRLRGDTSDPERKDFVRGEGRRDPIGLRDRRF